MSPDSEVEWLWKQEFNSHFYWFSFNWLALTSGAERCSQRVYHKRIWEKNNKFLIKIRMHSCLRKKRFTEAYYISIPIFLKWWTMIPERGINQFQLKLITICTYLSRLKLPPIRSAYSWCNDIICSKGAYTIHLFEYAGGIF